VVQQSTEGVSLFLKAPADPTAHPFWTPEHAEAGAWLRIPTMPPTQSKMMAAIIPR
jgi:hypothetical protein